MAEYFLGVDLGGTKVLTAVADEEGRILAKVKIPTEAKQGQDRVITNIQHSVEMVLDKAGLREKDIVRMGIGTPGPISRQEGMIYLAPNLGWTNVPIVQLLRERLAIPIVLENDANAAALAEKWFGAGQEVLNLIYVTVSTGIGGGIIINGKIFQGASDGAGEIGHMVIQPGGPLCGCGNRGCLETLASGTAIIRMAREEVARGAASLLQELCQGDISKIDGKLVAEAARQGDEVACKIWQEAGYYLGVGLANLLNVFNPEMIILGGGVMKSGDLLMPPTLKSFQEHALASAWQACQIKEAALGYDTGVKGAIAVAMEERLSS